ncbi:MAG: hypothetical protein ABIR05_09340 [Luteimonas sp.]
MERNHRLPFLFTALTVALVAAAPTPMPATATDAVLRCQAADGSIGYTDKSCAVFGATAVPLPDDLRSRRAHATVGDPDLDADAGIADDGSGLAAYDTDMAPAPGFRSPSSGCARSPVQLAMDVHAALAVGDVNRLAESYHFAGMSSRAGERALDRLQTLIGRSVIESHYFNAGMTTTGLGGFGDTAVVAGPQRNADAGGTLQLVFGSGDHAAASTVNFKVQRYAGCYFMRY